VSTKRTTTLLAEREKERSHSSQQEQNLGKEEQKKQQPLEFVARFTDSSSPKPNNCLLPNVACILAMQSEVPLLELNSHQPPTEIYLYEPNKLDDTGMDAETPAHGNLSMKTSQSPELTPPLAPKPFASSAKMFTFEGVEGLTPSNSDDEERSQTQVEDEEAQPIGADCEDREEINGPSAAAVPPVTGPVVPEPNIEVKQQMQPTEQTNKQAILLPMRQETPKEHAETPRAGPRRFERYMVGRKDDASENSAPFDEEPISPRGTLKSKKKSDSTRAIPESVSLQQKAIEEEIIFGTTHLTIGELGVLGSFDSGLVNATARPQPCPEVQAFVANMAAEDDDLAMAPTDELDEQFTTNANVNNDKTTTTPSFSTTMCGEIHMFDMNWCSDS
jgi:hypothetical protein